MILKLDPQEMVKAIIGIAKRHWYFHKTRQVIRGFTKREVNETLILLYRAKIKTLEKELEEME